MKKLKWSVGILFIATSLSAFAFEEGTDRGNGGDEYSKSFIEYGLDISEALGQNPIPGVDAKSLQQAVRNTFVNSQENLVLRGNEVDAINYPNPQNPRILVSRSGWDRLASTPHRRAFLVLHEYLGILGIDDSRYQISSLLDRAGVCGRTPQIRDAIEMAIRKSCYRIIQDDLKFVTSITISRKGSFSISRNDLVGLPNLDQFLSMGNEISPIAADTFADVPNLKNLYLADSVSGLTECGFFEKIPNLSHITLSYPTMERSYQPKFLTAIAPYCFARLPELRNIQMAIDAKTVKEPLLFSGIEKNQILDNVSINFKNIDWLQSEILKPLNESAARYLSFSQAGKDSISKATLNGISIALPKYYCTLSNWSANGTPQSAVNCNPK